MKERKLNGPMRCCMVRQKTHSARQAVCRCATFRTVFFMLIICNFETHIGKLKCRKNNETIILNRYAKPTLLKLSHLKTTSVGPVTSHGLPFVTLVIKTFICNLLKNNLVWMVIIVEIKMLNVPFVRYFVEPVKLHIIQIKERWDKVLKMHSIILNNLFRLQ